MISTQVIFKSFISIASLSCLLMSFSIMGCQTGSKPTNNKPKPNSLFVHCDSPRPEICTEQYVPVCASKDTGIRCVTTPCPSEEKVTYPNACAACADPKVYGYIPDGACD